MVPSGIVSQGTSADQAGARRMSIAEWVALPEDEAGELVDGYLVEEEMPDMAHEVVVSWLNWTLRSWIAGRGGFVAGSDAKFVVTPRSGRKPDLTVYLPGGAVPPRRGPVTVAPDIAVEVLSPTPRDARRDRIDKVAEYAAFGVRYYWIVDPEERSREILELGPDGHYARALGATEGRVDPVPGCAELALDLDALWAEVARLGPPTPGNEPG